MEPHSRQYRGIKSLPNEIIMRIFDALVADEDICTATCFGLASSTFYPILKTRFPTPIPLDTCEFSLKTQSIASLSQGEWLPRLSKLLAGFMGPKYRTRTEDDWLYLNREVFGDEYGPEEKRLRERENIYLNTSWAEEKLVGEDAVWEVKFLFPDPFNMGESWYLEARKNFEEFPFRIWDKGSRHMRIWREVKQSPVWERLHEDIFWAAWEEWTATTGF